MLLTMTLDWNCVLCLKETDTESAADEQKKFVLQLLEAHRHRRIDVAVTAVSAMENKKEGATVGGENVTLQNSMAYLIQRLEEYGVPHENIVAAPSTIERSFFDHSEFQSQADVDLKLDLEKVVSPALNDSKRNLSDKKRNNYLCDVETVHAHILSGRDVLVTNDHDDILKKRDPLSKLGLETVCSPEEAVERFLQSRPFQRSSL